MCENRFVELPRFEGELLHAFLLDLGFQLLTLLSPQVWRLSSGQAQITLLGRTLPELEVVLDLLAEGHELLDVLLFVEGNLLGATELEGNRLRQ